MRGMITGLSGKRVSVEEFCAGMERAIRAIGIQLYPRWGTGGEQLGHRSGTGMRQEAR